MGGGDWQRGRAVSAPRGGEEGGGAGGYGCGLGAGAAGEPAARLYVVSKCVHFSWGNEDGKELVSCDGQVLRFGSVRDAAERGKAYIGANPKVLCFCFFLVGCFKFLLEKKKVLYNLLSGVL